MIHIKNKKKPLEVTVEEMRKFSLSYLEKYAPSKQQLKTYLLKKYLNKTALNIKKPNFLKFENPYSILHIIYPISLPEISATRNASGNSSRRLS